MFPKDFFKDIERTMAVLNEIYEKTVIPSLEYYRTFGEKMSEIMNSDGLNELQRTFNDLGEQIRQAADEVVQYKSIIIELGYPPHESLPLPKMRMIVQDYNKHGIEYVKEYIDPLMEKVYDEIFLEELLLDWEDNDLVQDRKSILRSAIKCHKQQLYNSSVPTLLPQLEGIIAKGFRHEGSMGGYQQKVYLKHLLQIDETEERFFSFEEALQSYYLQYILVPFKHGENVDSEVSRHAILHGAFVDYGYKENSIKIILLFDFLLTTLKNLSEDTIQKAKDELTKK
jgi:hypothetical protein